VKRAVIKVGTAVLTDSSGALDRDYVRELCGQLLRAKDGGWSVVLVSSGAIRAGAIRLNMKRRPQLIPEKQAAAAVGQGLLLDMYASVLDEYGVAAAQVLLTRDDFADRTRYLNARNTLMTLLRFGALPIINENDTVAVDEIRFGDNDMLAALVATIVDADLVALLTDVEGLYSEAPGAGKTCNVIPEVHEITAELEKVAGGGNSVRGGTGGMSSKLAAARVAMAAGIPLVIGPGRRENVVDDILRGAAIGTRFDPASTRLRSRQRWMAFAVPSRGTVRVNDGAAGKLARGRSSLLPVGVMDISGEFDRGDLVAIIGEDNTQIARGFVNYSSEELRRIMGRKSSDIRQTLGDLEFDEVVHRDNMVIGV